MQYEIVKIIFSHPSDSWNSGLFAIIDHEKCHLCKIVNGLHQTFDNGDMMLTVLGNLDSGGHKSVIKTNLLLNIE